MSIKTPEELLKFMSSNIEYGYLTKDGKTYKPDDEDFDKYWFDKCILEDHDDVLKYKVGTCWDQTEFERKWFLDNGYEIKTFYEQVMLDYVNPYPSHSFLTFKKDNKWYWFEHSDESNRGIHEFDTLDELLNYQMNKHKEFLINAYEIKDEELDRFALFEFDKPKKHISVREYLMHATKNRIK